jgi:excisionase family DNA binding protein
LTAKEFAERAGVSDNTVAEWCREGKLKAKKVLVHRKHYRGYVWLIPEGELKKVSKAVRLVEQKTTPSLCGEAKKIEDDLYECLKYGLRVRSGAELCLKCGGS